MPDTTERGEDISVAMIAAGAKAIMQGTTSAEDDAARVYAAMRDAANPVRDSADSGRADVGVVGDAGKIELSGGWYFDPVNPIGKRGLCDARDHIHNMWWDEDARAFAAALRAQPAPARSRLRQAEQEAIQAARNVWGTLDCGFVRCKRCGDQEPTGNLDFVPELGNALARLDAAEFDDAPVAQPAPSQAAADVLAALGRAQVAGGRPADGGYALALFFASLQDREVVARAAAHPRTQERADGER